MIFKYSLVAVLTLFLLGCQTTLQVQDSKENAKDAREVLSAVAGALSGKKLSKEEIRNLEKQIQTDEEAKSAVQVITDSIGGKIRQVKYCPITGKRYASHIEICPQHQIKLEVVSP